MVENLIQENRSWKAHVLAVDELQALSDHALSKLTLDHQTPKQ